MPYADQDLNKVPVSVTDEQALLVGDVLATGFWAARISEITPEDTVLITGSVDGCDCAKILALIEAAKIAPPLVTHCYKLADSEETYRVFERKLYGIIKIAIDV